MKIKCHSCGTEISAVYDPENGPYEEVRANTVGWCPPCQSRLDAEYQTPAQRERQAHRDQGRYAKVNPCRRCGKSAGVNYFSFLCDHRDALGNEWHDSAIVVCRRCGAYLEELHEREPAAPWAELQSEDWGMLPQGRPKGGG